jgi:hypothetical protein
VVVWAGGLVTLGAAAVLLRWLLPPHAASVIAAAQAIAVKAGFRLILGAP